MPREPLELARPTLVAVDVAPSPTVTCPPVAGSWCSGRSPCSGRSLRWSEGLPEAVYCKARPLVRRYPSEPPQGRKAARVRGLWRVRGGPCCLRRCRCRARTLVANSAPCCSDHARWRCSSVPWSSQVRHNPTTHRSEPCRREVVENEGHPVRRTGPVNSHRNIAFGAGPDAWLLGDFDVEMAGWAHRPQVVDRVGKTCGHLGVGISEPVDGCGQAPER